MRAGEVEQVSNGIRRILAPNPSPMTGPGTNSYLIGQGGDLVLVDPGPTDASHLAAIRAALMPGERIAAIIVTHPHLDHSAAAPLLGAAFSAPVLGFGPAGSARLPAMQQLALSGLAGGGEGIDQGFTPDQCITDGQILTGAWGSIEVLHTPGHMAEHLCLAYGDVLLSADHAMGWSTSLISPPDGDMGSYMRSLETLMVRNWRLMLPGHGAAVRHVGPRLQELYHHRRMREAAILAALSDQPSTASDLAARLYTETPKALLPAAARNILAHLIDLLERKEVVATSAISATTKFALPEK